MGTEHFLLCCHGEVGLERSFLLYFSPLPHQAESADSAGAAATAATAPAAPTAPTAPNSYNCPGSPQLPPTATIAPNCPASSSCGCSSGGSGLNLKASSGSSWFWIFGPVWTPPTSGGSGGSGVRNLLTTLGWNVFSGDRVCVCSCRQLKKLSEDSLTKQPEEVFDILEKLGEG